MAYTQSTYTESMDITPCFTQPNSEEAGILFDSMTFKYKLNESLSEVVLNQALEFIRSHTRHEQNEKGEDRFYMDTTIDNLMVFKSKIIA